MLVDTSVWVDHLRRGDRGLVAALERNEVQVHPFVIGELACGSLRNRREILSLLGALPGVVVATHEETMAFVENHGLFDRGIGWIDAHLLASARLSRSSLWTRDKRLDAAARHLGIESAGKQSPT